jgi:hypothetical protein
MQLTLRGIFQRICNEFINDFQRINQSQKDMHKGRKIEMKRYLDEVFFFLKHETLQKITREKAENNQSE